MGQVGQPALHDARPAKLVFKDHHVDTTRRTKVRGNTVGRPRSSNPEDSTMDRQSNIPPKLSIVARVLFVELQFASSMNGMIWVVRKPPAGIVRNVWKTPSI